VISGEVVLPCFMPAARVYTVGACMMRYAGAEFFPGYSGHSMLVVDVATSSSWKPNNM